MPKEAKPAKRGPMALRTVFFGRNVVCVFATLHKCNIGRCFVSTFMLWVACSLATVQAEAQLKPEELPNPVGVVDAYATARSWIDQFDAPRMDDDASRVTIQNSTAVIVILRRTGRIVGMGSDSTGDDLMLRRAVGRALNDVLATPAFRRIASQDRNGQTPKTQSNFHTDVGRTLTLELEVAGNLTPLVGRSAQQMAAKLIPGLDGVAIRNGQVWEILFPSQLRATNRGSDPEKLLLNAIVRSRLPVTALDNAEQLGAVSLYRFRTIHLAQSDADRLPFQTFRGQQIVPLSAVSTDGVKHFAELLATHLFTTIWPDSPDESARKPLGIMGDYEPATDQYRPLVAPPLDQALVAFALARFSMNQNVDQELTTQAKHAAARILRDMSERNADSTTDPAVCAAITYAVTEDPSLRNNSSIKPLAQSAQDTLIKQLEGIQAESLELSPHSQAMVAGALCRLLALTDEKSKSIDQEVIRQFLDSVWQKLPENELVGLLPWIGWAEEDFATATDQRIQHVEDLRRLHQQLEDIRINNETSDATDLFGGFALQGDGLKNRTSPVATSQSVRPASWMAGLFDNSEIMSVEDSAPAMGRHLRTIRFLMQLSVREDCLWAFRNPARARGGVRASMWDSTQPVPAQALGLIAASDTLKGLQQLP